MNAYEVLNISAAASREEIRKSYRELARRWHPDRFTEGPEREWANDKMAEINAAYQACLDGSAPKTASANDDERLMQIEQMIDDGQYNTARRMLMSFTTRCAEWNYLFGAVLLRLCEREKARIYLTVAAHQNPASPKYARALSEVNAAEHKPARKRIRFGLHR